MDYPLPQQVDRARVLRTNSTDAEQKLWRHLRNRQLQVKFRRQHPIGKLIADFACEEARLVVEVDGGQHGMDTNILRDAMRTQILEQLGWRVIRFWNDEVTRNIDGVLQAIAQALTQNQQS